MNYFTGRWDAQQLAHHLMAGTFKPHVLPTWDEQGQRATYRRLLKIQGTILRNVAAIKTRMVLFGVNYDCRDREGRSWRTFRHLAEENQWRAGLKGIDPTESVADFNRLIRGIPALVFTVNRAQFAEIDSVRQAGDSSMRNAAPWFFCQYGRTQSSD